MSSQNNDKKKPAFKTEEEAELYEITVLFVEESKDLLSDLDQLLLRLEKVPLDVVVVDLLFRKVHSVKGGAGAIPQGEALAKLAHHFESVLSIVKRDNWQPPPEALDVFLEAADLCRIHLDLIANYSPVDEVTAGRTAASIEKLDGLKNGGASSSVTNVPAASVAASATVSATGSVATPAAAKTAAASENSNDDADEGVFVASDKLDAFMKLSGEMVVLKNTLAMAIRDPDAKLNPAKFEKKLGDFLYALNKVTDNLQEQIMSVRKVTLERALSKLPRLVRQTAKDVGKKIEYKTNGFDLGVDKTIAKALSASLTHMVRNSIDHGIELPETRMERGKDAGGNLTVTAREAQGSIQIVIEDDGGGIDRSRVIKKAIEKGLIDETKAETLTESEGFELIFLPGFSTAEQVSAVSGRGVGMDVVRSSILALNGRISIESKLGEGTRFILDIPVPKTVMVEQTVVAESKGTLIAIPLQAISRIIPREEVKPLRLRQSLAFQHENTTVRLIDHRSLAPNGPGLSSDKLIADMTKQIGEGGKGSVIVLRDKSQNVGLLVDAIYDQLEAVVRPFDSVVQQIPGFRGTTVLGDDQIAYVVSPADVISISLGTSEEEAA